MTYHPRILFLLAALVLTACRSTDVLVPDAPELAGDGPRTYVWAASAPASAQNGTTLENKEVMAAFRKSIQELLAEQDYHVAPDGDADLELALHLGISRKTRENDPYFAFYRVETLEIGHATLSLTSALTHELLWSRHVTSELRVTDRGFGHTTVQYVGSEEPQRWHVGSMARKVVRDLP